MIMINNFLPNFSMAMLQSSWYQRESESTSHGGKFFVSQNLKNEYDNDILENENEVNPLSKLRIRITIKFDAREALDRAVKPPLIRN